MDKQYLILFLNRVLANYFVMYVKAHRYKWFVKGEHIFIYQSFFEELYETLKEDIDLLVEHILAMDGKPFASMVKFIKETTLEEATADDEEEEIFEQLADDLAQINQEITEIGFIKADKVNDELSKQILLNLQQKLNMYIWRCKAYYK